MCSARADGPADRRLPAAAGAAGVPRRPAALLYGYSLWGGIKELTAAFLLALGAALAAALLRERPRAWARRCPLALAAGRADPDARGGSGRLDRAASSRRSAAILAAGGPACGHGECGAGLVSPAWAGGADSGGADRPGLDRARRLPRKGRLINGSSPAASPNTSRLGNLSTPLNVFQLAGIWPVGDFRLTPPRLPTVLWIGLALLAAVGRPVRQHPPSRVRAAASTWRRARAAARRLPRRRHAVGDRQRRWRSPRRRCCIAALAGAAMLWSAPAGAGVARDRRPWPAGCCGPTRSPTTTSRSPPAPRSPSCSTSGTWSPARARRSLNEYEVYADRHFLREGAPVEPAEYRTVTAAAARRLVADQVGLGRPRLVPTLDARTVPLDRHASLARRIRPPSTYRLVWQGRYYQLWQPPGAAGHERSWRTCPWANRSRRPIAARAQNGPYQPLCSVNPVGDPALLRRSKPSRVAAAERDACWSPTSGPRRSSRGATRRSGPPAGCTKPKNTRCVPTTPGTATATFRRGRLANV